MSVYLELGSIPIQLEDVCLKLLRNRFRVIKSARTEPLNTPSPYGITSIPLQSSPSFLIASTAFERRRASAAAAGTRLPPSSPPSLPPFLCHSRSFSLPQIPFSLLIKLICSKLWYRIRKRWSRGRTATREQGILRCLCGKDKP
jgi:hypothetical protein